MTSSGAALAGAGNDDELLEFLDGLAPGETAQAGTLGFDSPLRGHCEVVGDVAAESIRITFCRANLEDGITGCVTSP